VEAEGDAKQCYAKLTPNANKNSRLDFLTKTNSKLLFFFTNSKISLQL